MAPPAAAASLYQFLQDTGTSPGDYDGIFTGDLGAVGSQLLYQCLEDNHVDVRSVHQDCGLLLYDRQRQDVHAGGSGCGLLGLGAVRPPSPPHGAAGSCGTSFSAPPGL